MPENRPRRVGLTVKPVTPSRWRDLELLFGPRGACGGCWCMWWRVSRSQFERQRGARNKRALKRIVKSGQVPGLVAYAGREPFGSAQGKPVGWVALAPRPSYPVLGRSRVLQPVDEKPVWSITCFFVAKGYRGRGVATELLKAAVRYAKRRGARLVEGYPFEPRRGRLPDPFVWTGLPSMFLEARFHEVARRSPTRPIMRRVLPGHKGTKTQRI